MHKVSPEKLVWKRLENPQLEQMLDKEVKKYSKKFAETFEVYEYVSLLIPAGESVDDYIQKLKDAKIDLYDSRWPILKASIISPIGWKIKWNLQYYGASTNNIDFEYSYTADSISLSKVVFNLTPEMDQVLTKLEKRSNYRREEVFIMKVTGKFARYAPTKNPFVEMKKPCGASKRLWWNPTTSKWCTSHNEMTHCNCLMFARPTKPPEWQTSDRPYFNKYRTCELKTKKGDMSLEEASKLIADWEVKNKF